jgi:hypothetical protein
MHCAGHQADASTGVPTMRLNEAIRRNKARLPEDFGFLVTQQELAILISANPRQ